MKFDSTPVQQTPNVSPTEWILDKARSLISKDVFAARSWLLVAKSMFPKNFSVQYEAYRLEYAERDVEQCSALLDGMFQEFPSEPILWIEIESIIVSLDRSEKVDKFKQDIFDSLPPSVQQRTILLSAERQSDISLQCKLMLALMEKFPKTVAQYGVALAEKLVDEEKVGGTGSPLNHHRRLLVCEILPVICNSNQLTVSHKHFYKWLQKAAEFYATFFTTDPKISASQVGKLQQSWDDVESLRSLISAQCGWEASEDTNRSLGSRMDHIKDLYRRSRTDLTGNINKKQVFYTAILLLFEGAAKYMQLLEPRIYKDQTGVNQKSLVVMIDWNSDEEAGTAAKKLKTEKVENTSTPTDKELKETFQVARDAWNILHSSESFDKDFNHLHRRWKMDRWTWLQLFLSDFYTYEGNHKSGLGRLNNLMEQDVSKFRHEVVLRCHCQLVSSYYANGHLLMACQSIIEALGHLPEASASSITVKVSSPSSSTDHHSSKTDGFYSEMPSGVRLKLVHLNFTNLLPFWIHVFIKSFLKILEVGEEDVILGHLMVLSQHDWPKWQKDCGTALDIISKKSKYSYPMFFDYIISIDILEEIAFLKSNSSCQMSLLPDAPTSQQRITRGVNKGANEDFKKAMKRQVRKSSDCMETLLREFLVKQQDSLLNCLQSETSQEILEPMDVDI